MWSSRKSSPDRWIGGSALVCALLLACAAACGDGSPDRAGFSEKVAEEKQELERVLPNQDKAGGWTPDGEPLFFSGERLFDHIDGGADIYFEYGFVALVVQRYHKENKAVSVDVYRMEDPAAAFGIYTYNRHPSLSAVEVGGDGTVHSNGLFFWQDSYYAEIRRSGESAMISHDEYLALARALEESIGAGAEPPEIMNLLPATNKAPRSEVFATGRLAINNQVYVADEDLFGLEEGESAAIARYTAGQPEFSLIIAQYRGTENSKEAFLRFKNHFLGAESAGQHEFTVQSMPGKYLAVRQTDGSLIVVANADSERAALETLERVGSL